MFQLQKTFLALALVLVPFVSPAQSLSVSRLSAHLINLYTAGSSNIVAGHPRTLKVLGLDSGFPTGMLQSMRNYKAVAPTGKIVVRIYTPTYYSTNDNPTTSASAYWNIMSNALNTISSSDRALIDFLEGPNEGDTPTLGYPFDNVVYASQWFNQFWTNLTPRIVAAGYKPCIGSIAVGNPGGNPSDWQPLLANFVPALRQAKAAGGAWSYHAYTIQYTTDVSAEIYYSLRYRQFYSYFAASFPDLVDMPLLLTEGGVDYNGTAATSGWQVRGTQSDFKRWLNWFDGQMQQDSYLLGCQLFENGDPGGWSSFDLEPIASWMKTYLLAPTNAPPAPSGLAVTTGTASVTLTWTNAPLNPTSYNIKRSSTNGGNYTIIASNVTTGVTNSSYTDNSAANGGTYYYVVSAVNANGESTNSSQVTAVIAGLPDVVITSLSTSVNPIYEGNGVVFRATVKNQGGAATPTGSGKGIGIGFSLGSFFCYRGADENLSLAAGASQLFSANGPGGAFTWTAALGTHTLSATVDDINRFPEVDENNNTSVTNFDVGIRINCGGVATASSFLADTNFSGGTTFTTNSVIDLTLATGVAAAQAVYQSERAGDFNYVLTNLNPGMIYALRLHFAELIYTNVGQRVFNLAIKGTQVLTNFDIFAEAGGRNKALAKRFHVAANGSGQISLQFTSVIGQAKLSGLDLINTNAMPNALPVFLPISTQVVNANSTLSFTAKAVDADQPVQTLAYSFSSSPPAGASINSSNGIFSWMPTLAQSPGTNSISLQVSDGFASGTKIFQIIVVAPPRFSQIMNAPDGTLTLNISAFIGKTYRVEFKNNLDDADWMPLGSNIVASSSSISIPDSTIGNAHRFYRGVQLD
ncbi:MAG: malectin domain-containing carbohydrate-binding protein [Verrucomicrobiota bacterium]